MKTVLVAVSGMSPAIITETVWALACESPPVVPDEVVVITTLKGETYIHEQLLKPLTEWKNKHVWEILRKDIFASSGLPKSCGKLQLSIRVIEVPNETSGVKTKAHDLRTKADNAEAADFILKVIGPFVDAADQHVIASIAGGRKTMGALLYAAMSLVARETDRVTHVLVRDPFDMTRGFYYPSQPARILQAYDATTKKDYPVNARDAVIDLADIPFVPLRNGFMELNEKNRSFGGLVDRYTHELKRSLDKRPKVALDVESAKIRIQGVAISLTGRELLVVTFLFLRAKEHKALFQNNKAASVPYLKFVAEWREKYPNHNAVVRMQQDAIQDDLAKGLSSFRKKLITNGLGNTVPYLAPVRLKVGFDADLL